MAFFGILDKLVQFNEITKSNLYSGYCVSISDLEKRALEILEEINPGSFAANVSDFNILVHSKVNIDHFWLRESSRGAAIVS